MIGYFGKVSTYGDFVTRGLPPDLVAAWDGWLQACIQASREQLQDRWLQHYLTSPLWRFAIAPGVLGSDGLGGVMMPSVDRVGRYFPLMIGATGAPPLLDWFQKERAWYDAIEELALTSLDAGFRSERLDGAADPRMACAAPLSSANGARRFDFDQDVNGKVVAAALQGHSLWWSTGSPCVEASFLMCEGMPAPRAFAALLDGSWAAAGWR